MENQTIGNQTPTKENLNSVAQKEIDYSIDKIHEQAKQEAQQNKEQEGEKQGGDDGREH